MEKILVTCLSSVNTGPCGGMWVCVEIYCKDRCGDPRKGPGTLIFFCLYTCLCCWFGFEEKSEVVEGYPPIFPTQCPSFMGILSLYNPPLRYPFPHFNRYHLVNYDSHLEKREIPLYGLNFVFDSHESSQVSMHKST